MAKEVIPMKRVKELLNHTIDNNLKLEERGITPIAVSFEGEAGTGKTSVVRQVASERGMNFVKLNFAQIDEAGDLVGYPMKEYECQAAKQVVGEDGKPKMQVLPGTVWLNEKQLEQPMKGMAYRQTGKTRMGYAKPAWVPEYNQNGTLVLFDDYNRANQAILKAAMDLILEQKYISWSFPKHTTIVITQNPDNGSYNVESQDEAQSGRYLDFKSAFDIDAWAQWAENSELDGRCINFVLNYSKELFDSDAEGNHICNPRSFVMFANMISGVKDWETPENLEFIQLIAKGCFKDEGGRFNKIFASFIRNKMHLLIQPKEVLLGKWDDVRKKLEETVYDANGQFRPDLASLIERRFVNYVSLWLESDKDTPINKVKERILDFIDNPRPIFNQDLMIHMVKNIIADHKRQTSKLMYEPKIARLAV